MDELEFVAILNMSKGNESVGEEWMETRVFKCNSTLLDVVKWASSRKMQVVESASEPSLFFGNLRITVSQQGDENA